MKQIGSAANSKLNGEWAKHVRGKAKRATSKKRRQVAKKIIVNLTLESQCAGLKIQKSQFDSGSSHNEGQHSKDLARGNES